jgi:hypothetical protein
MLLGRPSLSFVRGVVCWRIAVADGAVAIQERVGEEEAAAGAMLVGAGARREALLSMAAVVRGRECLVGDAEIAGGGGDGRGVGGSGSGSGDV